MVMVGKMSNDKQENFIVAGGEEKKLFSSTISSMMQWVFICDFLLKLYNTIGLIYVTYLLKATCQHIFPFEGIKP